MDIPTQNKIHSWIMNSKLKRWLLFIPLGVLAGFIGEFIFVILFNIAASRIAPNIIEESGIGYYCIYRPLNGIIIGFATTYIGGYIAPHKKLVYLFQIIFILMFVSTPILSFYLKETFSYSEFFYFFFLLVGSTIGYYSIREMDSNRKQNEELKT